MSLSAQFALQNDCFPEQYQFDQSQFDTIIDPILLSISKAVRLHTIAFIHVGLPLIVGIAVMSCILLRELFRGAGSILENVKDALRNYNSKKYLDEVGEIIYRFG